MGNHANKEFTPLRIAVLTVSDTRNDQTDTSGKYLVEALQEAGHRYEDKIIVKDDIYQIRAIVSAWIAADEVDVILLTGGTGFTSRDSTQEAVTPLLDKTIEGFGVGSRFDEIKKKVKNSTMKEIKLSKSRTVIGTIGNSINYKNISFVDTNKDDIVDFVSIQIN